MLKSVSDWPIREWRRLQVKIPEPQCPLCFRTGHTPQRCVKYVDTKRDQKLNGQPSHDSDTCGRGSSSADSGSKYKHRNTKVRGYVDNEYKLIRAGCYFG